MDTTTSVEVIDITPEDSSVPIYEVVMEPTVEQLAWNNPDEMIAAHQAVKQDAIDRLKDLGFPEHEARAVIGL